MFILDDMVAKMMFSPKQSPLFDSPSSFDLPYEDVEFKAKDGVTLRGWLIPGSTDRVIVQSHVGVVCCRSGYTNQGKGMVKSYATDIQFLNQAKYLHEAGYTVLMYDMRGHGESDLGTKPWITWGEEEAQDVVAAVDYIRSHARYGGAQIGLFSICMGQGATTKAFGLPDGLSSRSEIKAMISVQPLDYPTTMDAQPFPGFLRRAVSNWIKKRTDIDLEENSWFQHVNKINVPVRVIQNRNDGFLNEDFVNRYYNSLTVEKKDLAWIELTKTGNATYDRMAAYEWIGLNPELILGWFDEHMGH